MRNNELLEMLSDMRCRLDTIEKWQKDHGTNHHGAKSKVVQGVPWTVISIMAYTALNILWKTL